MIMNSFEKKNHLTKILIPISIKALYNINHEDNHEEFFFFLSRTEVSRQTASPFLTALSTPPSFCPLQVHLLPIDNYMLIFSFYFSPFLGNLIYIQGFNFHFYTSISSCGELASVW